MSKLKKSEEEKELKKNPINSFTCGHADCSKLDSMVHEEFKHHLFQVHQIKADQLKGTKQMTIAHGWRFLVFLFL